MNNMQIRHQVLLGSLVALTFAFYNPTPATAKSLVDFKPSGTTPTLWESPAGTPNQPPAPPAGIKPHNPPTRYIPVKPVKAVVSPEAIPGEIIVKFNEATVVRLKNGQLSSVKNDLADVKRVLAQAKARIQRLSGESEENEDKRRNKIQGDGGLTAPDMNSYYLITLNTKDRVSQAALIDALNALPDVAIAYAPGKASPAYMGAGDPYDRAPISGSYDSQQKYLDAPPWGVNARSMWNLTDNSGQPIKGQGVRLNVIEYGWDAEHEDYKLTPSNILRSDSNQVIPEHGTATIGVLAAAHNAYGVSGLAPNVTLGLAQLFTGEQGISQFINAFAPASSNAGYGDIAIFEQEWNVTGSAPVSTECAGIIPRLGPVEMDDAMYDKITQSALEGKIVIEPAGNHGIVFESCFIGSNEQKKLNRQATNFVDSGAIIVGAGLYNGFSPLGIPIPLINGVGTNAGNRVDMQGWGANVVTTGPIGGAMLGDPDYTNNYTGTSSATPIVAGAAALTQSYFKNVKGRALNGYEMRQLLMNTGTPGAIGNGNHIGPLPDVIRASQSNLIAPTVTANNVRGSLSVPSGTPVSFKVSLDPAQFYGTKTDYWMAVDWNGTLWHWSIATASWSQNQAPWFQNVLYGFSNYQSWNPTLYTGNYTFYFCVDTIQNGVYKNSDGSYTPALYCGSATVTVY